jgi:hypothetical protein
MNPVSNTLSAHQSWLDSLPPVNLANDLEDHEICESEQRRSLGKSKEKQKTQASLLVEFTQNRCELFHDKNRDGFAFERDTNTTMRLDSRTFKDWLQSGFYVLLKTSVSEKSLREAVATLRRVSR